MINWDCSKETTQLIHKIGLRVVKDHSDVDLINVEMDIMACHLNGCPLDLEKLLKADDFNFYHDVWGIARHIDRNTGKLTRCFLPRCYDPKKKEPQNAKGKTTNRQKVKRNCRGASKTSKHKGASRKVNQSARRRTART